LIFALCSVNSFTEIMYFLFNSYLESTIYLAMNNKDIKAIGLFSGGGGLDLGFAAAGFNILLSSDIDAFSCETLIKNQQKKDFLNSHPVLCEDINNLNSIKVKDEIKTQPDIVIGGPPCQAFSIFGRRRGLADPRGNLVFEYARLIEELSPSAFVFENVSGLRTIHNGELYNNLLEVLSIDGKYTISAHEYEVAEFGVPQFRKRIFFIGSSEGKTVPELKPTHSDKLKTGNNSLKDFNTVESIMKGLPTPITNWKRTPEINGHVGRNHSERIINRYKSLIFGERDPKTRINKLDPNRPSYTIIVGSDAGGGKGHVHPYQPREVTPRESARIQTFPDWWEFSGTGRHIIRQVGNAVPPLFAATLGNHIMHHLFNSQKKLGFEDLVTSLDLGFNLHATN
jgi:DNA (cytosine-5)-methyltransferase 1